MLDCTSGQTMNKSWRNVCMNIDNILFIHLDCSWLREIHHHLLKHFNPLRITFQTQDILGTTLASSMTSSHWRLVWLLCNSEEVMQQLCQNKKGSLLFGVLYESSLKPRVLANFIYHLEYVCPLSEKVRLLSIHYIIFFLYLL